MADTTQNFSQLLLTYGPGAMMDLPDHAVVVSGLQGWNYYGPPKAIEEERLIPLLREQLKDIYPELEGLRPPPEHDPDRHDTRRPGVDVIIFPRWFTVEDEKAPYQGTTSATGETERRMVEFNQLTQRGDAWVYMADGHRHNVNPVRFAAACPKGHLQDIEWRFLTHRGGDLSCRKQMFWVERGVSSDPSDISVRCSCGARVTMVDLYKPKFIGTCSAHSPWLRPPHLGEEHCDESLRLLPRSATNTYFAQTITAISLTQSDTKVRRVIAEHAAFFEDYKDEPNIIGLLRKNRQTKEAFSEFSDEEILAALRDAAAPDTGGAKNPKVAEFDVLASGTPVIGHDDAGSFLFAETLVLSMKPEWSSFLKGIVRISRLREVTCLYGFTRLEPPPTTAESELDDIQLNVNGAPLARETRWLPAIEQFGEGIFLHVNPEAIASWVSRPETKALAGDLRRAEEMEASNFSREPVHLGVAYWALHSLSHALMSELALECGYPISSLKERIYSGNLEDGRFGLLIYTSTAGSQGTLGGLSGMAERIPYMLSRAVETLDLCSNDPICADHQVGIEHDERPLHGAACHACLLVPETSCEARNTRLDRRLIVPTLMATKTGLFAPLEAVANP